MESEKCQGFKRGVRELSKRLRLGSPRNVRAFHEGSPRIVKGLRRDSENRQAFKSGVQEMVIV